MEKEAKITGTVKQISNTEKNSIKMEVQNNYAYDSQHYR